MSRFVLTAQLQLQAPNNVGQIVQQIQNQLNGVTVNVQVQNSRQAQRQLQQVTQATNQATTAAERMGKAFSLSVRRFAAFSVATRAVSLFTNTLGNAVQDAIDFERQLIKVGQVTGKTVGQLRGLTKQITSLSTGFGVASSDLLEVSTVLAQAGLTAEDTAVALRTLAKAALAPNFDSITETAEGAIAILAQFQQGVGALEAQLGSINAVAGAFAVEASDLIDVIRRTGGVFKASGGSLNELLALFTSVRATTRESAESIGTGLRTIFTRIQRPKTIEFLKQFGVELVDLNGKFVGPYEAIKRLSEALSGLGEGDLTFISIAEELGGFRQIGKVLPLLQQFSTAQSALNVAMKAGDSLTQDAASAQAALAIRIMKVKEEFLALIRSLTETSTFQIMANTALSLASALIKIADSIKPLLPMLAALAAFRMAKGMGSFFGGMMSGATSGRTYNKGGKVLGFARGGLVPGSGNGDTVPAMLAPGEFVIRKSSVNKMGAGTLAAMNENRYADGGRAIVGATQKLKSTKKRDGKYGVNKDVAGAGNIQFDVNDGQIGAFVLTPPKGSEGGYSATQPFPFTLPAGNKYAKIAASQAGLSPDEIKGGINAVINPATYPVFYPGMQEGKRNLENNAKYAAAAHKGFLDGISTGVNSTINSVVSQGLLDLPPGLNTNEKLMTGIVGKIQSDNQVRSTIEGYLFEAMISAFTGATAAGGRANFDFPRSAISQNKDKLGTLFGSQAQVNKLIKAEAKRSYGEVGGNVQRKLANDIINGYKGGVTLRTTGQRKHFGGIIQKFANGGMASAPLVDDILSNASGSLLPRPSSAIASLIKAGGGAIDIDRTLKRTIGDKAYANAKTGAAKDAVLSKYFRDDSARLNDIKSAPLTAFGKELQVAIKSGQLNPGKLSIISKSSRTRGVPEYLSQLFGIPIGNMIFTGGGSKQPAMDALRSKGPRSSRVARFATGGSVGTDTVPALLTPGEFVVNRSSAQRIGYGNLNRMNKVGKYAKGGVVQHFARGTSGTGVKPSGDMPVTKGVMPNLGTMDKAILNFTGAMDKVTAGLTSKFMLAFDSFGSAIIGAESLSKQYANNIAYLNKIVPGFSSSLQSNSEANKRNLIAQQFLADSIAEHVNNLEKSGASQSQIQAKVQEYISALDRNTLDLAGPTSPKTGAIVQPAAGAVAGGAGKSTFASNQTIASLESFAPGLTKSLNKMAQSANMSAQQQEELAVTIEYVSKNMQQAGKPVADVAASLNRLKARVDSTTSDYEKAKVPLAPMSDVRMLETAQANSRAALKGAVGGFAQTDDGKLKSTAAVAFETGQSRSDLAKARKQALQDAGFVKGSNRTTALTTKVPEATFVPEETKEAKTSRILQQARGQSSQAGTATALAAANTKAAAASMKAANADNAEANASNKAAAADKMKSKGGNGMMGGGKMMAASMATSLIQGFLPALDESSSAATRVSHSLLGLLSTITSVGFALEAFGVKLNKESMGQMMDFLKGGRGTRLGGNSLFQTGRGASSFARSAGLQVRGGTLSAGKALSSAGLPTFGGALKSLAGPLSKITTLFANLGGPLIAITGSAYIVTKAFNSVITSFYDYDRQLKQATEKGDIGRAKEVAGKRAALEGANYARAGGATAGAVLGFVLGGPIGAAIGAALGAGLTTIITSAISSMFGEAGDRFLAGIGVLFGGNTYDSAIALAAAQAGAVKTQKALDEAQRTATKAMEDFKNGSISASDALSKIRSQTSEVSDQQKRSADFVRENEKNRGGTLREVGAWATLGFIDSNQERNDKLGAQNVEQINQVSKFQAESFNMESEARQATIRSGLARGKSIEDIRSQALGTGTKNDLSAQRQEALKMARRAAASGDDKTYDAAMEQAKQLGQQIEQVNREVENIEKAVKRAKESFEAMNLGLRSAQATSSALSASMTRFSEGFEVGGMSVISDVKFLQEAMGSAAQAMDPTQIKEATANVAKNLRESGVSPGMVTKFEGNISAFTQAQAGYNKAFENVKKSMAEADFQNLSPDELKKRMAEELTKGLGPDVSAEAKENLKKAIGGMDLTDEDVDKILGGDLGIFGEKLGEEQKKMFEPIMKIMQERAAAEQVLIDFTKKRIDAERNLVAAQQEALDLQMEGREVQAKYGGPAVSVNERRANLLAKSNVEGGRKDLGLTAMKTGSIEELRQRNTEIRTKFAGIESRREQRGGMDKTSGAIADETQKDLQKAYKTQIDTIRGLIKLEEEQLKITQEKNKLEKESMESLIKGDVESFFKQQAAVGATAAIASGDQRLMNYYGADALGMAYQDIQRQQEAGVQELYGQRLGGAGGLTEAAAGAALSARGVTDMRAAQVMAGTTAEEEASKSRLRELGGMLGETGELGVDLAEMQVNTAQVNLTAAQVTFDKVTAQGQAAAAQANAAENMPATALSRGGVVYASRGIFVPRGTDTVPAMLTPGEFVVNRNAVQRGNNLQVLQAMNGGAGVSNASGGSAAMSTGGRVRYFSDGGEAGGSGGGMFGNMSGFLTALSNFGSELKDSINKLTQTNIKITLDSTNVSINLNDGGLLKALTGQVKNELFKLIESEFKVDNGGRLRRNSSVLGY